MSDGFLNKGTYDPATLTMGESRTRFGDSKSQTEAAVKPSKIKLKGKQHITNYIAQRSKKNMTMLQKPYNMQLDIASKTLFPASSKSPSFKDSRNRSTGMDQYNNPNYQTVRHNQFENNEYAEQKVLEENKTDNNFFQ